MNVINREDLKDKLDRGENFELVMTFKQWAIEAMDLRTDLNLLNILENKMSKLESILKRIGVGKDKVVPPGDIVGCSHMDRVQEVSPSADGCEDCLKTGDSWVHLRICMTCGHVGCCDNSKNTHARKHYHASDHAIVKSFEPGENWLWCFEDKQLMV